VLPVANAYLQSGQIASPRVLAFVPALLFLAASSAIASGLSDEESDREGGKRTFVTWLGNATARRLLETCVGIGFALLALSPALPGGPSVWVIVPALAVLAWHGRRLPALGEAARTSCFREQAAYKDALHRGLWGAQLALAVMLLVGKVVG
jgi:1,4-dihydroxy-2-naphthoate octaprenyltransferase/chlorophyll synthase